MILLLAGSGLSATAAGAAARGRIHATATSPYIHAERLLLQSLGAGVPSAVTAAEGFLRKVLVECPEGGIDAPYNVNAFMASKALGETVAMAFASPYSQALARFASTIEHLRFPFHRLETLVRRRARLDQLAASYSEPLICSELKELAASGFHAQPEGMKEFLERQEPLVEAGSLNREILAGLAANASPAVRSRIRALARSESDVARRLVRALTPVEAEAVARFASFATVGPAGFDDGPTPGGVSEWPTGFAKV